MTYKGIVRHKDGSTNIYEINKVQDWQEARQALLDTGATCALVIVPKPVEEFAYEPQTA